MNFSIVTGNEPPASSPGALGGYGPEARHLPEGPPPAPTAPLASNKRPLGDIAASPTPNSTPQADAAGPVAAPVSVSVSMAGPDVAAEAPSKAPRLNAFPPRPHASSVPDSSPRDALSDIPAVVSGAGAGLSLNLSPGAGAGHGELDSSPKPARARLSRQERTLEIDDPMVNPFILNMLQPQAEAEAETGTTADAAADATASPGAARAETLSPPGVRKTRNSITKTVPKNTHERDPGEKSESALPVAEFCGPIPLPAGQLFFRPVFLSVCLPPYLHPLLSRAGKRKSIKTNRFDLDMYCDNEEQAMLQQALKVNWLSSCIQRARHYAMLCCAMLFYDVLTCTVTFSFSRFSLCSRPHSCRSCRRATHPPRARSPWPRCSGPPTPSSRTRWATLLSKKEQ